MQENNLESNGEKFTVSSYNGISVIRDENGYYNASKICKDNKVKFKRWKQINRNQELLQKYSKLLGKPVEFHGDKIVPIELPLILNKNSGFNIQTRGFYIHPRLVHHVCEWCNLDYAIQVEIIMNLINEETKIQNKELKDKIKEMNENLENLKLKVAELSNDIQNNSVKTRINTRNLRIYDATNYEVGQHPFDLMDEDCLWWVSANHLRTDEYRVLLEVQVVSSMHARMDMKEFFNRNKVNGKLNTVKPSCKELVYDYIMKTLKPKIFM